MSFIRPIKPLTVVYQPGKRFGKSNILHGYGILEKRGNILVTEASNPTPNPRNKEEQLRVLLRKGDELVHVRGDRLHSSLHCRNGIALTAETDTASHNGAEILECSQCRPATVHAFQVAPENEHLIRAQFRNDLGSESRALKAGVDAGFFRFPRTKIRKTLGKTLPTLLTSSQ